MKLQTQREIVVEFERVRLVRKKAKTHLLFCRRCRREIDVISLCEAASLFDVETTNLFQFIETHDSHYEPDANGAIFICLISLLACLKTKADFPGIKLIGD